MWLFCLDSLDLGNGNRKLLYLLRLLLGVYPFLPQLVELLKCLSQYLFDDSTPDGQQFEILTVVGDNRYKWDGEYFLISLFIKLNVYLCNFAAISAKTQMQLIFLSSRQNPMNPMFRTKFAYTQKKVNPKKI